MLYLVIIGYLLTRFAVYKKWMSLMTHQKLWNIVLLMTFIVTSVTALPFAIDGLSGLLMPYLRTLGEWHTDFGLVMIIVAVFHAAWHWRYMKAFIKKTRGPTPA